MSTQAKMTSTKSSLSTIMKQIAADKEARKQKMMRSAVTYLNYYNTIKQQTEDMWNDSPEWDDLNTDAMKPAHDELMEFLNTKIHELKIDAEGGKRFMYTVKVSDDDVCYSQFQFKTSEEVYNLINTRVMDESSLFDYGYDEAPYTVPTAAEIDALLDSKQSGEFNKIFSCGEKSDMHISFDVIRNQINY